MKLFLYVIIALYSLSTVATENVIQQAVYAHINGVNRTSIKVYRSGETEWRLLTLTERFKFLIRPTITFFDANNKSILTENIKPRSFANINKLVTWAQSRVGQLPKVSAVDVVAFKGPGWKSIEMFDEHGNRIVQTNYGIWGRPVEGSPLSQEIIDHCSPLVSNPDDLKKMRIRHDYWEDMKTGEKIRVKP